MTEQHIDARKLTEGQRAVGFHRRLQALAWNGWPPETVAAFYGFDTALARYGLEKRADRLRHRHTVTPETWHACAMAFDDLALRFGPDKELRERAVRERWSPPLAWDDDALDNSNARPQASVTARYTGDPVVVYRRIHGDHSVPVGHQLAAPDRHACIRILHAQGMSDPQIGDRIGVATRVVHRDRKELGLPANVVEPITIKRETLATCCATRRSAVTRGHAELSRLAILAEKYPHRTYYREQIDEQRRVVIDAEAHETSHAAEHAAEQVAA